MKKRLLTREYSYKRFFPSTGTMTIRILKICAAAGGWILLFLLAWQFRSRLLFKINSLFPQTEEKLKWEQHIESRKINLQEIKWKDERPLTVILGDSQVEMGNWYELFHGQFAVRNVGLSRAKIQDVARLADGISQLRPAFVMLFCGINDLGSGRSIDEVMEDYIKLLDQVGTEIRKDQLIVISIMPVAKTRLADGSKDLNSKVQDFNSKLQKHCHQNGIAFVNVTPAISNDGMLRKELTSDGLHLNPAGYRQLAESIRPELSHMYEKLEAR